MSLYSFLPPPGSALYGDLPPPETPGLDPKAPLPPEPSAAAAASASANESAPATGAAESSAAPAANAQVANASATKEENWAARTKLMPTAILKRPAPAPAKPQKTAAQILAAKPTTVIVETKFVGGSTSDEEENPDEAIRDEYDPAKPNDYMKWKAEEARRRRHAEVMAEREREYRERMEREAAMGLTPGAPKVDMAASGEEAFLRRAAMSGRAPPPMPPEPERSPPSSSGGGDSDRPEFLRRGGFSGSPSPHAPAPDRTGPATSPVPAPSPPSGGAGNQKGLAFAAKLMQKMGWQAGSGLGKTNQGITTALSTTKTSNRQGVIVNAGGSMAGGLGGGRSRPLGSVAPTKVVLLQNMVGPGEVDPELQGETAGECAKYGRVDACKIVEVSDGSVPPEEAVRIFVKFFAPESATKALNELNGRYFGGRQVRASYFDEERFARGELAPTLDDY